MASHQDYLTDFKKSGPVAPGVYPIYAISGCQSQPEPRWFKCAAAAENHQPRPLCGFRPPQTTSPLANLQIRPSVLGIVWVFVSPQESCVKILFPTSYGICRWRLWKVLLSHEGRNPLGWDSCLHKRGSTEILRSFCLEKISGKSATRKGASFNHVAPWFWTSSLRTCKQ